MRRRTFIGAGVLFALGGCAKKKERKPEQQYPFRGQVVGLDAKEGLAAIRNEKIDGWMAPMTMDYPIPNRTEFAALHVGDTLTGTVNTSEDGYWLTDLHVIARSR